MMNKIIVQQIKSGLGRNKKQIATLQSLGLKMHKIKELNDTPEIRGMIRRINHLIKILP